MNKAKGNRKLTWKNIINLTSGVQIFQDILKKQTNWRQKVYLRVQCEAP